MNNEEKHVFGDGKYCIFERDLAERRVYFYGALVPLHEPEDEPGGDCRENRRNECICIKSESKAVGDPDGKRRLSAKKVSEINKSA
jgi:hypothetical protein